MRYLHKKICSSPASELEVKQTSEGDLRAVLNFVAPLGPVSQASCAPYLMCREEEVISSVIAFSISRAVSLLCNLLNK